jgi:hypothetical protein
MVADLNPAGTEVVEVTPGARSRREHHHLLPQGRLRRAVSAVTAKLGSGSVRRPAAVFVSSIRITPLARSVNHLSRDRQRRGRFVEIRPLQLEQLRDPQPRRNEQCDRVYQIVTLARLGLSQFRQQAAQLALQFIGVILMRPQLVSGMAATALVLYFVFAATGFGCWHRRIRWLGLKSPRLVPAWP